MPAAVVVASLSLCAGVAFAGGGGVTPPNAPKVTDVVCVSTCGGIHKATTGSKAQLSGRHLGHVTKVLFKAEDGGRVAVHPIAVASRSVKVRVPDGAATGRPKVTDSYTSARSPTALKIVRPSQIGASGSFRLQKASARPRRSYYYGKRKPRVTYMFTNTEPTDVRIDVVKRHTGKVVDSWVEHAQEPNTRHTARWSGLRHGRPAFNGSYRFRIGPQSGSMESTTESRFRYHRFEFPVRGRHTYGDGVGAPRSGHIHEGQDVLAPCGTPLVAVRGGRVQWKASQAGGAGNYVVIDGKRTGHDWMYAHLKSRSRLRRGQVVRTGQRIGAVGQTGDATGCHLHVEEWSAPGWYEGGHFMRAITRHLKQWDRWS